MKKLSLILIGIGFLIFSCKRKSDRLVIRNAEDAEILYYNNFDIKDSIASITFDLALDQVRRKKFPEAKRLLLKANEIEPNNIIIINGLGNVETELKNFDKSLNYFESAIKIDSTDPLTYLNLGVSYNKNSEEIKAINTLKKGLTFEKDSIQRGYMYYTIADAYYDIGEYKKSQEFNQKALRVIHEKEIRKDLLELDDALNEYLK